MPASSYYLFLAGVFVTFLPAGLLTDIPALGANSAARLVFTTLISGLIAVAYVVVVRMRRHLILPLIALHILLFAQFERVAGPKGPPLNGEALRARLAADVNGSIAALTMGFVLLSQLIRREGTRYGQVHAEIALAAEIHTQLVPLITGRVGQFEFRGVSSASGEVGGDLVDLVESPSGWTSYVMDVSGHGVGAGVLMGMAKSTARTQLREGRSMDAMLANASAVLFDLKAPTMFVTFAGMQWRDSTLRFSVAGHLPILRYVAASSSIEELSIAQLPLAMFPDTVYGSAAAACEAGDLLVVLTDGLTEVFDRGDREFGLERVKDVVRAHAQEPLGQIEAHLLAALRAHGPQLDDQTLLLVRVLA
jgi:serine phosphatase RsbU (regulator of sigma subunit)